MNQNIKDSTLAVLAEDIAKINYLGIDIEETLNHIYYRNDSFNLFDIVLKDGSILNNIKINLWLRIHMWNDIEDTCYDGCVTLVYFDEKGKKFVFGDATNYFDEVDWRHLINTFAGWLAANIEVIAEELGYMIEKYVA